jgi:peptide chain release factor 2
MQELKKTVEDLKTRIDKIGSSLELPKKRKELEVLETEASEPKFWHDQETAQKKMQELGDLKNEIEAYDKLASEIEALFELSESNELTEELKKEIADVQKKLEKLELTTYLSGSYDKKDAIVSIHAGQGGTEAMDWTSMLFRMYFRFCERRGWKVDVLDENVGEEAGLKNVSFLASGAYAYGYLKHEAGTHRLVRQSPFNADNLRQTSFAQVEVLPELEESDIPEVEIKDEDLDWQFFRSGGHGGQNVNKVSTAVRLTHKPSGIVVTAQTERFQAQNRKNALNLLRAKLWAREMEKQAKEKSDLKGDYVAPSWGTQIRSYVLHPYKMVKDLRTQYETSDTEAVLDGDLDDFIEAELKM